MTGKAVTFPDRGVDRLAGHGRGIVAAQTECRKAHLQNKRIVGLMGIMANKTLTLNNRSMHVFLLEFILMTVQALGNACILE